MRVRPCRHVHGQRVPVHAYQIHQRRVDSGKAPQREVDSERHHGYVPVEHRGRDGDLGDVKRPVSRAARPCAGQVAAVVATHGIQEDERGADPDRWARQILLDTSQVAM